MKKQKEIIILNTNEWFWKLILKNTKKQIEKRKIEKLTKELRFKLDGRFTYVFFKNGQITTYEFNKDYIELSETEISKIREELFGLAQDTLNRKEGHALKEINRLIKQSKSELKKIDRDLEKRERNKIKLQEWKRRPSKKEWKNKRKKFDNENKREEISNKRKQRVLERLNKRSNFRGKLMNGELSSEEIFERLGGVKFSED